MEIVPSFLERHFIPRFLLGEDGHGARLIASIGWFQALQGRVLNAGVEALGAGGVQNRQFDLRSRPLLLHRVLEVGLPLRGLLVADEAWFLFGLAPLAPLHLVRDLASNLALRTHALPILVETISTDSDDRDEANDDDPCRN